MESSETSPAETPKAPEQSAPVETSKPSEQSADVKKQNDAAQAPTNRNEGKRRSGRQRSNRSKGGSNKKRPKGPNDDTPLGKVRTSFFACARCSYFLSTLRVLLTLDGLEQVVADGRDGWLTTPWSHALREHLERCYGIEIFSDTTHYQGTCLECGRNFVVSGEEESAEMTRFEIQAERLAPYPL